MYKKYKKTVAGILATAMVFSAGYYGPVMNVEAQQVSGNAPFINSWLVSGPFDKAVADKIYGLDKERTENFAKTAQITASSYLPVNPPSYLVDGDMRKQWVSEDGKDFEPWVQFEWEKPVSINQVKMYQWGDGRHSNQWYHLTFTLEDGSTIESGKIDSVSGSVQQPTEYVNEKGILNVVKVKIEIDKGRDPYPSITGLSEVEILGDVVDNRPEDGN